MFSLFKTKPSQRPQETAALLLEELFVNFNDRKVEELMKLLETSNYEKVVEVIRDLSKVINNYEGDVSKSQLRKNCVQVAFRRFASSIGLPIGYSIMM